MTRRVPSPRSLWAGRFHTAEILGRFSQPSRSLHTSLLKNPNDEILRVCKCDKSPSLYKETGETPLDIFLFRMAFLSLASVSHLVPQEQFYSYIAMSAALRLKG